MKTSTLLPALLILGSWITTACEAPADDTDDSGQAATMDEALSLESAMRKALNGASLRFRKDARFTDGQLALAIDTSTSKSATCRLFLADPNAPARIPMIATGDTYAFNADEISLVRSTDESYRHVWRLPLLDKIVAAGRAGEPADFILECGVRKSERILDAREIITILEKWSSSTVEVVR